VGFLLRQIQTNSKLENIDKNKIAKNSNSDSSIDKEEDI
jgi:hypothetical protein